MSSLSRSALMQSRSPRWAMFMCLMPTMPYVRSFTALVVGRTPITFTWFNPVDARNVARWHFVISCASTPTPQAEHVTLKKHLASLVNAARSSSREAYANGKSEFIERVLRMALAAGHPRGL